VTVALTLKLTPYLADLPSDEYLDREEVEFVSGLDALMDAAHYSRLSRQEWETAAQEEFTARRPSSRNILTFM